jgi:hypothetical protein
MDQALTPITVIDESVRESLMMALAFPEEGKGLIEIAKELDLKVSDVITLLNDPTFLKGVKALTLAQANFSFHSDAIKALLEIVKTGKASDRISAARTLGQITGNLKSGNNLNVKLTFDELRKRPSDDPLSKLFDIKTPEVIDAELEELEELEEVEE